MNLRVCSAILVNAYRVATARFSDRSQALVHALMAYNTGSIYAGEPYVRAVITAATSAPIVPSIAIIAATADKTAPILPPAQVVAPPSRPTQLNPRQAALRVSGRWDDSGSAGIVRNLILQVSHGLQSP